MKGLILCFHVTELFCSFMDASRRLKAPGSEMKESLLLSVARVLDFVLITHPCFLRALQRGSGDICTHSGSYYKRKNSELRKLESLLWPASMPIFFSRWRYSLYILRLQVNLFFAPGGDTGTDLVYPPLGYWSQRGWACDKMLCEKSRPRCGRSQALSCMHICLSSIGSGDMWTD